MNFLTNLKASTRLWQKPKHFPLYEYTAIRRCSSKYFDAVRCRVVVITGGKNHPTLDLAENFADTGAHAVVIGTPPNEEFFQVTDKLNKKYGEEKIIVEPCDVTKKTDVTNLFKLALKLFKRIDLVVNSTDVDGQVDQTISTNINSLLLGTFNGFNFMGINNGGVGGYILNVCSILGLEPFFGSPVYAGAKHFVIGFSRSMGSNYFCRLTNVKLFTICVGITNINTVPIRKTNIPGFETLNYDKMKPINKMPAYNGEQLKNCLFNVFEDGQNGSIWVVEDKDCFKLNIPIRTAVKIPENAC